MARFNTQNWGGRHMMHLDHIVVTCDRLADGVAHVEAALGVPMQAGGQHVFFGTHNAVLGLADGVYLEVIAADPAAPAPEYLRWFALDGRAPGVRLSHWVCAADDLGPVLGRGPGGWGLPITLERGDLRWAMVTSETGEMPWNGGWPGLLQWYSDPAAGRLTPSGLRLEGLEITHPQAGLWRGDLGALLNDARVMVREGPQGMRAVFDGPDGRKVLE